MAFFFLKSVVAYASYCLSLRRPPDTPRGLILRAVNVTATTVASDVAACALHPRSRTPIGLCEARVLWRSVCIVESCCLLRRIKPRAAAVFKGLDFTFVE